MFMEWFLRLFPRYRKLERELKELDSLAHEDVLTQVWNRNGFKRLVEPILETMERQNGYQVRGDAVVDISLVLIDIDKFKPINDTFGHEVGDEVLKRFAQFLKMSTRRIDVVGRWYQGDEFVIAFVGVNHQNALRHIQILKEKAKSSPMLTLQTKSGQSLQIGASFGVASVFQDPRYPVFDLMKLAKRADVAMYQDKQAKNA